MVMRNFLIQCGRRKINGSAPSAHEAKTAAANSTHALVRRSFSLNGNASEKKNSPSTSRPHSVSACEDYFSGAKGGEKGWNPSMADDDQLNGRTDKNSTFLKYEEAGSYSRSEMLYGSSEFCQSAVAARCHKNQVGSAKRMIKSVFVLTWQFVLTLFGIQHDVDLCHQCETRSATKIKRPRCACKPAKATPIWRCCVSVTLCALAAGYLLANLRMLLR